ncbi:unnamed protein product, partial [Staurois parvus]
TPFLPRPISSFQRLSLVQCQCFLLALITELVSLGMSVTVRMHAVVPL